MILNEKDVQEEILFNENFYRKIDREILNIQGQTKFGKFSLNSQAVGNSQLIKWKSSFAENTKILGEMATPSVRIYFLNNSKKGIYTGLGKKHHGSNFKGNTNILFCNGDSSGYTLFGKEDMSEITTIAITAQRFSELTQLYPELFEQLQKRYTNEKNFILHPKSLFITLEISNLLQQIENSHLMGNAASAYADAKTLELLALQITAMDKPKKIYCKTNSDITKLHEAKQIITSNLNVTYSLQDISKMIGINENKLKYGFKEVFGTTVFGFLFDYKMQLAKQLLTDTDKSVSEIAILCGYDYPSHFSTSFKRKHGISPLEMRRDE